VEVWAVKRVVDMRMEVGARRTMDRRRRRMWRRVVGVSLVGMIGRSDRGRVVVESAEEGALVVVVVVALAGWAVMVGSRRDP